MRFNKRYSALASTAAIALAATPAFAQEVPPADASEEIVVTATKQADTINRVPVSITAVTQEDLDNTNVRTIRDLSRTVPALAIQAPTGGDRTPSISIRGIASTNGAQTTGLYLDDIPLQKRNALGVSGSGSPIPQIFDLERVEVLRGPQGTLYGGSSLGGTIRFISPAPSLDTFSLYARGEVAYTEHGGITHDTGVAVGGPLIDGVLGFRASAWIRDTAGYVDHVDRLTGDVVDEDANSAKDRALRLALMFQPIDGLRITPSIYYSYNRVADTDSQWDDIPAITTAGNAAHSYPAFDFDRYESGHTCNIGDNFANSQPDCIIRQPRKSTLLVPSLKVEQDLGKFSLVSVSSYIEDRTSGQADISYLFVSGFQGGYPFVHNLPFTSYVQPFHNNREGFTQEIRLATDNPGSRFNFVGGFYYAKFKTHSYYFGQGDLDQLFPVLLGRTPEQVFGAPMLPGNISYQRDQRLKESSLAVFGEASFMVTDKLKLIAGARVSRERFSYDQTAYGPLSGFIVPTIANGGLTTGSLRETPFTPKLGVQYLLSSRDMIYFTAAKGFRVGGVNQTPPAARCAADLNALGITSTPATYGADKLWSYEVGAKVRPFGGRMSVDASAYYIDWQDVQVNYALPTCGFGYVINGGRAVSKGFDIQAEVKLVEGLTLSGQLGYTDAKYTRAVVGPGPSNTLFVRDGDRLPVPKWSVNAGAEYRFAVGTFESFFRFDYQHASGYQRSFGPGTGSYAPDTWMAEATDFVTARAGVERDNWSLSLFVDNLFNSDDRLAQNGGRAGCAVATGAGCTTYRVFNRPQEYITFRPRTFGLTVTVRQ